MFKKVLAIIVVCAVMGTMVPVYATEKKVVSNQKGAGIDNSINQKQVDRGNFGYTTANAETVNIINQPPYADKIGVGVSFGGNNRVFVDIMKTARWANHNGLAYDLDENGWPKGDIEQVIFDQRPVGAWWGEATIDDPDRFHIDISGTYKLSFTGQADLNITVGAASIENKVYDGAVNKTSADIIISPSNDGFVAVAYVNTRRLSTDTTNTGMTDIRMIRPGYQNKSDQLFTDEFLNALKPFSTLRFMGWRNTNNENPPFSAENNTINWSERPQASDPKSWETIIALGNTAKKDMWINIPVHATDGYIQGLAELLKNELDPSLKVYVEYSNEVWGFDQSVYNKEAAVAEINSGNSNLNDDGTTDQNKWAARRYARRDVEISNIFRNVFGNSAINNNIRVVHCWWVLQPAQYKDQLDWIKRQYGEPSNYIYAIAGAPYINAGDKLLTGTVDEIIEAMRQSSDSSIAYKKALQDIADSFGVKQFTYEGGTDTMNSETTAPDNWDVSYPVKNIANRIRAERDPRIKDLLIRELRNNWFPIGGDLFMFLELSSAYSRYGCWGLTEDSAISGTYKLQAVNDLVSNATPIPCVPYFSGKQEGDRQVTLDWTKIYLAGNYNIKRSTSPAGPFATIGTSATNSYIDTGLKNGVAYYYKVSAVNTNGESADSPYISAIPIPLPNYLINENFDNAATGSLPEGWINYGDYDSVNVIDSCVAEVPDSNNKSLMTHHIYDWRDNWVYKTFTPQTKALTLEYKFMDNSIDVGSEVRLWSGNTTAILIENFWGLKFNGNGILGGSPNTWYSMKVVADITNQKADVYVNGNKVKSDVPFLSQVTSIDKVSFGHIVWDFKGSWDGCNGGGPSYFDDVKVYDHSALTGVELDKNEAVIKVGKTETLTPWVFPDTAANKAVTWNSSDTSVAAVDENGIVTALNAGEAVITATTVDGGFTAKCIVKAVTPQSLCNELVNYIAGLNLPKGMGNSFLSKLHGAIKSLDKGNTDSAVDIFTSLIEEAKSLKGIKLSEEQSNEMIRQGEYIIYITRL